MGVRGKGVEARTLSMYKVRVRRAHWTAEIADKDASHVGTGFARVDDWESGESR